MTHPSDTEAVTLTEQEREQLRDATTLIGSVTSDEAGAELVEAVESILAARLAGAGQSEADLRARISALADTLDEWASNWLITEVVEQSRRDLAADILTKASAGVRALLDRPAAEGDNEYCGDTQTRLDNQIAAGDHDLNEIRNVWANCKLGWRMPRDVVTGMDVVLGTTVPVEDWFADRPAAADSLPSRSHIS